MKVSRVLLLFSPFLFHFLLLLFLKQRFFFLPFVTCSEWERAERAFPFWWMWWWRSRVVEVEFFCFCFFVQTRIPPLPVAVFFPPFFSLSLEKEESSLPLRFCLRARSLRRGGLRNQDGGHQAAELGQDADEDALVCDGGGGGADGGGAAAVASPNRWLCSSASSPPHCCCCSVS